MSDERPTLLDLSAVLRCVCGEDHEFDDMSEDPCSEYLLWCDCGRHLSFSPGDPIVQFAHSPTEGENP